MELSHFQLQTLLKRFPSFELSYETITHKKVLSPQYELALSVPAGRKYFLWFTFHRKDDVCYLMELNKDKRIVKATLVFPPFSKECSIGTILYGTMVPSKEPESRIKNENVCALDLGHSSEYFVVEDIYYYKGVPLKQNPFYDRLCFLKCMFERDRIEPENSTFSGDTVYQLDAVNRTGLQIVLPFFWLTKGSVVGRIPESISTKLAYIVHHIQYRDLYNIRPYVNVNIGLKESTNLDVSAKQLSNIVSMVSNYLPDYKKPQYRYPTIFRIMADLQYDIYHLYAFGSGSNGSGSNGSGQKFVYYDIAYIPNCQKSVFMNGLFRNIRENRNLDYIEESDDEDEFQDTRIDKNVNLTKEVIMECSFHPKFKRWVPIRVVGKHERIVPIHKL